MSSTPISAGRFRIAGKRDARGAYLKLTIVDDAGHDLACVDLDPDQVVAHCSELMIAHAALAGGTVVPFFRPQTVQRRFRPIDWPSRGGDAA